MRVSYIWREHILYNNIIYKQWRCIDKRVRGGGSHAQARSFIIVVGSSDECAVVVPTDNLPTIILPSYTTTDVIYIR